MSTLQNEGMKWSIIFLCLIITLQKLECRHSSRSRYSSNFDTSTVTYRPVIKYNPTYISEESANIPLYHPTVEHLWEPSNSSIDYEINTTSIPFFGYSTRRSDRLRFYTTPAYLTKAPTTQEYNRFRHYPTSAYEPTYPQNTPKVDYNQFRYNPTSYYQPTYLPTTPASEDNRFRQHPISPTFRPTTPEPENDLFRRYPTSAYKLKSPTTTPEPEYSRIRQYPTSLPFPPTTPDPEYDLFRHYPTSAYKLKSPTTTPEPEYSRFRQYPTSRPFPHTTPEPEYDLYRHYPTSGYKLKSSTTTPEPEYIRFRQYPTRAYDPTYKPTYPRRTQESESEYIPAHDYTINEPHTMYLPLRSSSESPAKLNEYYNKKDLNNQSNLAINLMLIDYVNAETVNGNKPILSLGLLSGLKTINRDIPADHKTRRNV